MLTEEEAKARVCPHLPADRVHRTYQDGHREQRVERLPRCLASECLMWRWQELLADEAFGEAVIKAAEEIKDTSPSRTKAARHVMQNRAKYGLPVVPFRGWCGLAGKPGV